MGTLPASVGAITLFVTDAQRSKAFYQNVFGVPVTFEDDSSVMFKFGDTILNFLAVPAAHELIAPAKVASREAGASFQFTIWVEDTDAACAELAVHGVPLLNGPVNRPWGMRTATFEDPDGHIWEVAQELPQSAGAD